MTIEQFTPRERTEGDSFKPSENVGKVLIVKVSEHKFIQSTLHKPDGGWAIVAEVHDLSMGQTLHDVLWMNGAVVDELKPWLGKIIVVKFAWQQPSKAGGQAYITVVPADANEMAQAQARMNQGDPFAVQLQTPGGQQQQYAPPPPPQQQFAQGGYVGPAQTQTGPPPPPQQQDPWTTQPQAPWGQQQASDQPPF
jgi:hypothetical protein